jgi:outer membrane protein assembly factor BamB
LPSGGIGGLAVAQGLVIAGCRNATDRFDIFVALDAETGVKRWQVTYLAEGKLDYGNSPRATPLIAGDHVFLFGAFGDLRCVSFEAGRLIWERRLGKEYESPRLEWGLTVTPLLIDGLLIAQPGGSRGCLVALDAETGEEVWKTTPGKPGHGAFIPADIGGRRQLIGHDAKSLGGWDVKTGERLWTVVPPVAGDFQVPTPIFIQDDGHGPRLFVTTENNGSRLYGFRANGTINAEPLGTFSRLAPNTHSPVQLGDRIYGIYNGLHCLKLDEGLSPAWRFRDRAFVKYGSLLGMRSSKRLLATTLDCQLILLEDQGDSAKELDRLILRDDGTEMLSHPALVDLHFYLRLGRSIACLKFARPTD